VEWMRDKVGKEKRTYKAFLMVFGSASLETPIVL